MTIYKTTRIHDDGKETVTKHDVGGWTQITEPGDETRAILRTWTLASQADRAAVKMIRPNARVVRQEQINEKGTIEWVSWAIFDGRQQLAEIPWWSGNRPAAWRSAMRHLRAHSNQEAPQEAHSRAS